MNTTVNTPWVNFYGDIPATLTYDSGTMYDAVLAVAEAHPTLTAFHFMGKRTTYAAMMTAVNAVADSLYALGVRTGDSVTIALPNCPQAIYLFYAVNLIGGLANMVHPLASESEIAAAVKKTDSNMLVTLDAFYQKANAVRQQTTLSTLVIASVKDELPPLKRVGFQLTTLGKIPAVPVSNTVLLWRTFLKKGFNVCRPAVRQNADDASVILYSGGTTGASKGVVLTNRNFNALTKQIVAANPMFQVGDIMLAAMPIFHGFGLGVCVHSMLASGGTCVLMPRFTPETYAKMLVQYRCQYIAGVPTLFESLMSLSSVRRADFSSLKGVFSGGDTMTAELKSRLDTFLKDHGATVPVREGYGATETVTACCLMPPHISQKGSIGIPLPDVMMKIVKPNSDTEQPYGEEGEIVIAGPTVMKEYWRCPEETAQTIRTHRDNRRWVHTGDLGVMDERGFFYFKGRIKRMIVSSGYNIYPAQLENVLDAHEYVQMSCVIGVPDSRKMQAVKAFVVLKPHIPPNDDTKQAILDYCRRHIAAYALPKNMTFVDDLPKTLVGKIDYRRLEEAEQ